MTPKLCSCGDRVPVAAVKCLTCGKKYTHRDWYPEQYTHRLVGKYVKVKTSTGFETEGFVERVVRTRFGALAHLDSSGGTAYQTLSCTPAEPPPGRERR